MGEQSKHLKTNDSRLNSKIRQNSIIKVQIGLLMILIVSFLNYLIGSFIPPTDEKKAKGFIGYNCKTF